MGVAAKLQRVRQHNQIKAGFGKGQRLRQREQREARGLFRCGCFGQRQPAVLDGRGGKSVQRGQPKLQRVVAKRARKVLLALRALKRQQALASGAGKPLVQFGAHVASPMEAKNCCISEEVCPFNALDFYVIQPYTDSVEKQEPN